MTYMHDPYSQQKGRTLFTLAADHSYYTTSSTLSQNEQRLRMMHKSMTFVTAAATAILLLLV